MRLTLGKLSFEKSNCDYLPLKIEDEMFQQNFRVDSKIYFEFCNPEGRLIWRSEEYILTGIDRELCEFSINNEIQTNSILKRLLKGEKIYVCTNLPEFEHDFINKLETFLERNPKMKGLTEMEILK